MAIQLVNQPIKAEIRGMRTSHQFMCNKIWLQRNSIWQGHQNVILKQNCFCVFLPSSKKTVVVAQLVRASDCDSEGRGFEPPRLPKKVVAALQ